MTTKQEIFKPSLKRKTKAKLALQASTVLENLEAPKKEKKAHAPKPEKVKPEKQQSSGGFFHNLFTKPLQPEQPVIFLKEPPVNAELLETYTIQAPYSQVNIYSLPELGGGKAYFINETKLPDEEKQLLRKLTEIVSREMEPPKNGENPVAYLNSEAKRLVKKYKLMKPNKEEPEKYEEKWGRILYHLQRDFLGFGPIHVIMNDPMIEDLSVNGLGTPVYIWHRKFESMPTNLTFTDEAALDNLIVKLTHLSSKHLSTAYPILDAMLPGKDRLAATFKREVSPKGGSFTIRRFREEPFSIIDLIEMGTINEQIAAYLWMLIENRMTIAVIGGTGAGKTSTLNAIASLVKPQMKLVTVEEIPEMNVPHENWVQLVSRDSYGLGTAKTGEVTLFDLVRTSLRYRPDYIVVGEIRGEEAFVLFQALATGHGGLTTLHADSIDYAIKRLTSPPMNVSKIYVPLINVAAMIERVQLPKAHGNMTFGRRITALSEVLDYGEYKTVAKWNPADDTFTLNFEESEQLLRLAARHGLKQKDALAELQYRANMLADLRDKGIRKNVELSKFITNYYVQTQAAIRNKGKIETKPEAAPKQLEEPAKA
ncbi:MAG TPA: type II/IV secretion system ATPase subunit [Candidatus Acidoferrales bacterium]|nr:type II/IV secretion system ATPase subunit [Candidatus Acidoferrales bacterium]